MIDAVITPMVGRTARPIAIAAKTTAIAAISAPYPHQMLACCAISTACTPAATDARVIAARRVAGITPGAVWATAVAPPAGMLLTAGRPAPASRPWAASRADRLRVSP